MPPRTRKSKPVGSVGSSESNELSEVESIKFRHPPVKSSKKVSRAKTNRARNAGTRTPAAARNAGALDAAAGSQIAGIGARESKQNVVKAGEDLKAWMYNISGQNIEHDDTDYSQCGSALAEICTPAGPLGGGSTRGERNEAFDQSINTLRKFQDIVKEYSKLQQSHENIRLPSLPRWRQDTVDLHELNESLMINSMRIVENLLVPDGDGVDDTGQVSDYDDVRHIAWELLEEARLSKAEESWGNRAKELLQGVSNLMRSIA